MPPPDKPKRWRPRFSVRTLVVIVTLLCAYVAAWKVTLGRGIDDVLRWHHRSGNPTITYEAWDLREWGGESAPTPFFVTVTHQEVIKWPPKKHYYFWFFGYVAKLPYEREMSLP